MAKNNTCDGCGHYCTSHSAGGCTVRVMGKEGFEFCSCQEVFDKNKNLEYNITNANY